MNQLKLGKLPAVKNSVSLRFRDYLSLAKLPVAPLQSGDIGLADSNLFGNDKYGDCVCAGAGHETLYWNRKAGKTVEISEENVLNMYSLITGFNPAKPDTDQGTSVPAAAKWRKKVGLSDSSAVKHKVLAYVSLSPGNAEEIKQAISLFGVCGIGWELPQSALDQAEEGKSSWSVVSGSPIAGGHYTAAIAYDPAGIHIISWGKVFLVPWAFVSKYMDEGIVYLSEEFLTKDSPFDLAQLKEDLKSL